MQKWQSAFGPSRLERIRMQASVFVLGASRGPLVATYFPKRVPDHLPEGVLRVVLGLLWRFQLIRDVLGMPFGITFPAFLGGLIFSGILTDLGEGSAAGGACLQRCTEFASCPASPSGGPPI